MKKQGEKFVVISGGAGGIGRAAALKLAELEYYPVLLDRDDAAGRKASAALAAAGFENEFHCAELANERQVGEAFAKILSQHKRVDVLTNPPTRRKSHVGVEYLRRAPKGDERSALSLLASGS